MVEKYRQNRPISCHQPQAHFHVTTLSPGWCSTNKDYLFLPVINYAVFISFLNVSMADGGLGRSGTLRGSLPVTVLNVIQA